MEQFINGPIMVHVDRNAIAAGHAACIAVYSPEGVYLVDQADLSGGAIFHTCDEPVWPDGPVIITLSWDGAWVPAEAEPSRRNSWGLDAVTLLPIAFERAGLEVFG